MRAGSNPSNTFDSAFLLSDSLFFGSPLSNDFAPWQSDPDYTAFWGTGEPTTEAGDQVAFISGLDDPTLQPSLFSDEYAAGK